MYVRAQSFRRRACCLNSGFYLFRFMQAGQPIVFVADDNAAILQGLERALSAKGYQVRTAEDGTRVMDLLRAGSPEPDLLLLDVMMPELGGLEVLRAMRADARWAQIPVMLITAAVDDSLAETALQDGAVDFLPKPFRLDELLGRVGAQLQRRRGSGAVDSLSPFRSVLDLPIQVTD